MGPSQTPQIMMDIVVLTGMLEGEKIIHLFYKENPLIRREASNVLYEGERF